MSEQAPPAGTPGYRNGLWLCNAPWPCVCPACGGDPERWACLACVTDARVAANHGTCPTHRGMPGQPEKDVVSPLCPKCGLGPHGPAFPHCPDPQPPAPDAAHADRAALLDALARERAEHKEDDEMYQAALRENVEMFAEFSAALGLPAYLREGEAEVPGYPHILAAISTIVQERDTLRAQLVREMEDVADIIAERQKFFLEAGDLREQLARAQDKAMIPDEWEQEMQILKTQLAQARQTIARTHYHHKLYEPDCPDCVAALSPAAPPESV